jgi:hypothetical protein
MKMIPGSTAETGLQLMQFNNSPRKIENSMTIPHLKKSIGRSSSRLALLLIPLVFACFMLSHSVQAVSPTPDGLYPGANVAEGGTGALFSLTTGTNNTAVGNQTLFSLRIGSQNTAVGAQALKANTTDLNTAVGFQALNFNVDGPGNTATGWRALFQNTSGSSNTAIGNSALYRNTTGVNNVAVGTVALTRNTTADGNTAVGVGALSHSRGGNNTALGFDAGINLTTGFDNIDIGNDGVAGEQSTIRIGNQLQLATYIAGISGANATGGNPVFITSDGKLGTINTPSSARFKDEIKPMDKASEAILALKPVTFRYKKELDPKAIPQFGLVAEEVEKVNPDLVKRDRDGNLQTVRYEAVNAMLLNEFLKARRQIDAQQKQIDALTAGLQKVSAQVEASKPAPQVVNNNQ